MPLTLPSGFSSTSTSTSLTDKSKGLEVSSDLGTNNLTVPASPINQPIVIRQAMIFSPSPIVTFRAVSLLGSGGLLAKLPLSA